MQTQNKPQNADEYIAEIKSQLSDNEECGNNHYNLGVALMGKQEFDEAEKALHDAVECSPTLAEAYVLLGGLCLRRGDMEGCLNFNRHAIKARAGFAEGYANIGFVLIQMCTSDDGEVDMEMLDQAIKHLRKAIVHNSNFVQAYTTLGNAYYMKGLLHEAVEANLKAIERQAEFPIAHNNLAVVYLELGEYAKAIEHGDLAAEYGYEISPGMKKELDDHR
ncbi:MAG: hypothetical protein B6230_06975 [Desulfobacteraceae bacterium 4572_89]|nr:MAG: hypothetical protein B6230_06975 [Desulfobacteraceae bacterium 4572_89]